MVSQLEKSRTRNVAKAMLVCLKNRRKIGADMERIAFGHCTGKKLDWK